VHGQGRVAGGASGDATFSGDVMFSNPMVVTGHLATQNKPQPMEAMA
jgi:hypothetical protein